MSGYLLDFSIVIPFLREQTAGNAGQATRYLGSLPGRARVHLSIVAYAEILEHAADPIELAREFRARLIQLRQRSLIRVSLTSISARGRGR